MTVDHEPVILDFEALEAACKLSFNEDQRARLTSAAEAYRAWSRAGSSWDKGGLLCSDQELRQHLKQIAETSGRLAELLNVDLCTHPREYEVVDQLWDAMGLEKPTVDPREKGLSMPSPPNPETKFFRPRALAVILETYSLASTEFEERMPKSKGGRPEDWDLAHYVKALRAIYQEAGGKGRGYYKNSVKGGYAGAFYGLVCEWISQTLGIPKKACLSPARSAIEKERSKQSMRSSQAP
jgi:hypothetical protein